MQDGFIHVAHGVGDELNAHGNLEDQDKFRTSGIFRDVYLLNRPKAMLFDYTVTTSLDPMIDTAPATAVVEIRNSYHGGAVPTTAELTDREGRVLAFRSGHAETICRFFSEGAVFCKQN